MSIEKIQLFEDKKIRTVWIEKDENGISPYPTSLKSYRTVLIRDNISKKCVLEILN